ncbi:MAG TPA: hypothetical protein DCG69_05385 [Bacteroidales bacterium]|nr:hypothetical protein [Bacteroidales bacterium]
MKNSVALIRKKTVQVLWLSALLFSLVSLNSLNAQELSDQAQFSMKSSSPSGENIIISMMDANRTNKENFIQIYNADKLTINLTGWTLVAIEDGNEICTWTLSGTIRPGETKTAGDNDNHVFIPNFINTSWFPGNNKWDGTNDGAKLYHNGVLIDNAYSTTNWSAGVLIRNENTGTANTLFTSTEWTVFSTSFDENQHACRLPIIDIGPGLWSELTVDYLHGVSYNIIGLVEVDIDTPAECYSVYIQNGNSLQILPNKALTINKNLNNYGGNDAFVIKANSSGTGSVIIYGISDNGTMEHYFIDTRLQSWQFIASPIENAKSAIYEGDYMMYYYEPQQRYVSIIATDVALKVGRGYSVLKRQDPIEKYEGMLNGGTIKLPTLTNSLSIPYSTAVMSGWNLIGNPYPSSIDWDKVEIPTKMHGQVSVWIVTDQDGEFVSDWKVWVKGFGDNEAHFIQPGEGFFVFTNETETLSFNSTIQAHYFGENSAKGLPDGEILENSEVMEIKASGNNVSSSFHFRFLDEALFGFDSELDAFKMLSESPKMPQIYFKTPETILAANSIPHPSENDTLHLSFSAGIEGAYQLDFEGFANFDYAQNFYLKDNLSGEIRNLRLNPNVKFNHKLSDPENRFDLLFGLISGTDDVAGQDETSIFYAAGKMYVKTELLQTENLQLEIRNLLGQTVYSGKYSSEFENGKSIALPNATYLVSLRENAYLFSKKVAVFN